MKVFTSILQLIGGMILSIGYIPQISRIVRTKSVKDFSFQTLIMIALGIGCMEVYAIYGFLNGEAMMFFVTNTVSFLIAVVMVLLYVRYRGGKK